MAAGRHHGTPEVPGARRARQVVRRRRRVEFSLSEEEYARVRAAARDAGLANGAYAARATLAAVQSAAVPAEAPFRDALAELIRASGLGRADPPPGRGRPGCCGRGRVGRRRHAACRCGRAGQSHDQPSCRRLRSRRPPTHGRIPHPTRAGRGPRHPARLLSALGTVTHDESLTAITLLIRLATLAEAVADLRHVQRHAAQAAAARTAAERLRAATSHYTAPPRRRPAQTRPRPAAQLGQLGVPLSPALAP